LEDAVYYLATVLGLGIAAQWIAWRLRIPSILLLLAFGFAARYVAGLSGLPGPDDLIGPEVLFAVVSLSVAVILFEGGLSLRIGELRESGGVVLRLVSIGVVVTWLASALAAWAVMGLSPPVAALAGAILVVTGPTVIVPMLRQIRPSGRIGSIVKWEGIVIDPIGAVLAVLVFQAVTALQEGGEAPGTIVTVILAAVQTAAVGAVAALVVAVLLVVLLKRYWIPDFLHVPLFLAAVMASFAASNYVRPESGLITVTLLGIVLANQKFVPVEHVIEFKENLRVLLISCLFIVLASRVELSELASLGWRGPALLAVLILVVRPLSVFLSTLGTELNLRERVFLALMAPRGIVAAAVASVFAMEMAETGDSARELAPLVFLVIVGTVAVYGLLAGPLARRMELATANPQGILFAGADRFVREIAAAVQDAGFRVLLVDTNYRNISAARMAGLPTCCASVLSEYVGEELDLVGLGRLLAVTPNDEVNALAVRQFTPFFGRSEVYQLSPWDVGAGRRQSVSEHLRGRVLFGEEVDCSYLARRFSADAQVKRTSLTEEFTYDDFTALYGKTAVVLFVIEPTDTLTVCTAESPPAPKPGQTLIAVVDPTSTP